MTIRNMVLLLIVVALGFSAFYLKDYFDKTNEADALAAQAQSTSQLVSSVANQTRAAETDVRDLTKRSGEVQTAIDAENLVMPARFNSNEAVKSILLLGKSRELLVIPLNTQEWTKVKIGTHDYQVFRMTVEVNGPQERLVDFVKQLQDSLYETLVIENMVVTKPTPTPTPTTVFADQTPAPSSTTVADTGAVKAKIQIAIYAR
jgi:hypothetical protein